MKILLLTHAYNSLCQRLHVELMQLGHDVSVEFDINDAVTGDAVTRFNPELIIAPFLKRAIPASIWQHRLCWIVHPGIVGDRGPSSLDWAILNQETTWGVTILQANADMDGGDVWAWVEFPMRIAAKSSLYRQEVTQAATTAVKQALSHYADKRFKPQPLAGFAHHPKGRWRCMISQADRAINWQQDTSETVIRKIHSADGNPGLLTCLVGHPVYLFNAFVCPGLSGQPGELLAQKEGAVAIATRDSAVWITHVREKPTGDTQLTLKLPAADVLSPWLPQPLPCTDADDFNEVWCQIEGDIAYLHFDFYNGAMGTEQCRRLLAEYLTLVESDVKAIVLMGGGGFWSNGIHLNLIEQHNSAADESWRNINAINDLCLAIIETTHKLTVAAINGNAGAGGVFLALACDIVAVNDQTILNPHYKSMGNLHGSEYWSYLLPKRVGLDEAQKIMQQRLPVGAFQARALGLVDCVYAKDGYRSELTQSVKARLTSSIFDAFIVKKTLTREQDEQIKPLQQYRDQELAKMKLNFYGFDPSYHMARYHFVYKLPKSRTPAFLAKHRVAGYANAT